MARSILRAGKIAGVIIITIAIAAVVLYWAGVITIAQTTTPAPEPAAVVAPELDETASAAPDIAAIEKTISQYTDSGRHEELEAFCNDILAQSPGSTAALCARDALTRAYIRTGRDARASASMAQLLDEFGDVPAAAKSLCIIGDTWRGKHKLADAEEAYRQTVARFPNDEFAMWSQQNLCTIYLELGDMAAADAAAERLLTDFTTQEHLAMSLCFTGDAYKKTGNLEKAIDLYSIAANQHADKPGSVNAQKNLCMTYLKLEDHEAADAAVEKLLADFTEHDHLPLEICYLGDEYKKAGDFSRAIELYQHAANDYPDNPNSLFGQKNLCIAYLELKDTEAASLASQKMLTNFAKHPRLPFETCLVGDEFLKAGQPEAAFELYSYMVDNYPDNELTLWAQKNICTMYIDMEDEAATSNALEVLKTQFKPKDMVAIALMQIADKYRDSKKHDRALQLCQYVIDTWPATNNAMWAIQKCIVIDIDLSEDPNDPAPNIPPRFWPKLTT